MATPGRRDWVLFILFQTDGQECPSYGGGPGTNNDPGEPDPVRAGIPLVTRSVSKGVNSATRSVSKGAMSRAFWHTLAHASGYDDKRPRARVG